MPLSTTLLLGANPLLHFKWNQFPFPPHSHSFTKPDDNNKFTPLIIPNAKRQRSASQLSVKCLLNRNRESASSSKSPLEVLASTVWNALRKPAIAAVLVGLLLMYDPNTALAASGGRMGGRSFSSSSSRSYSVHTPSPGFSFSAPYYGPSPFGGGVYVGPAVGFGVGAGSSFFLILVGFAAFVLVSGFLSDRSEGSVLTAAGKTTVLKLQVSSALYNSTCLLPFFLPLAWVVSVLLLFCVWKLNNCAFTYPMRLCSLFTHYCIQCLALISEPKVTAGGFVDF